MRKAQVNADRRVITKLVLVPHDSQFTSFRGTSNCKRDVRDRHLVAVNDPVSIPRQLATATASDILPGHLTFVATARPRALQKIAQRFTLVRVRCGIRHRSCPVGAG